MASEKSNSKPWEYTLRKYLLLMATVAAALTYAAAFSPPGGVWQDTGDGHLAGDPIIRDTHYRRYLVFFYCNATAFASSLVVIVLILLLSVLHENFKENIWRRTTLLPLRVVMVLDLLSLMGAYAAGTCRDAVTTVYSSLLVAAVFAYLMVQTALASASAPEKRAAADPAATNADAGDRDLVGERPRKVLMLLATFAISVTYVSGLSTPGGFWDGSQPGRRAGDAILEDYNRARLVAFFLGNTTAFVASLVIILLLLDKKLRFTASVRSVELYGCIVVALVGLVVAYAAGSCRDAETTAYVVVLVTLVLGSMVFLLGLTLPVALAARVLAAIRNGCQRLVGIYAAASKCLPCLRHQARERHADNGREEQLNESMEKARSLVLLLGTLATSVTYQAGLDPPGGVWQDDGDGHMAGDPILLTTNPRRYKAFYYFNSTAFMASLAAIVLVQKRSALKHGTLEAAMILDLFALIGAYATGSCRDVGTSIYVMAMAAGVVVYVAIHVVVFFTLGRHKERSGGGDDDDMVEKRRKRLLVFAILAATITYQAGLTPPSGFWPEDDGVLGHRAGEPVLLSNYPRRYRAFFYSNSLSFMSAIAHILLLVHPRLYRPAIRSYALSVCTAAGLLGLMAAYAAGSTQHLKTSIYIFVLAFLVVVFLAVLLFVGKKMMTGDVGDEPATESGGAGGGGEETGTTDAAIEAGGDGDKKCKDEKHAKSKYLMLLGILMASVTYAAGLEPPGGVWQSDGEGHTAGDSVLRTNRRLRYLFFFHCNSTSFVASILVVVLLLPQRLKQSGWWLTVTNMTVVVNLFGLLGAHAAGSSRGWETSGYAVALVVAALAFAVVHALMACFTRRGGTTSNPQPDTKEQGSVGHQPLGASV
ncbi:uncharacterized protein LOC101760618 [Setaria italica]|nr:uncharacterized protein LOC101760618 [Setaria italica]